MAAVLLICVPLIPVSIVAVQKFAKKLLAKYWGSYTQLGDSFLENLQGLTTLKIYQADERYAKKMDEEAEQFRRITMRVLIMQLNSISVMDLVAYGGATIGIILSVLELKADRGILGKSGCGKSTLLKLLMRFYQADNGQISYGEDKLEQINTGALRSGIAYVTQETFLFQDTIENNIKVAKENATREEVIAAAKKASIHDFIMSTPQGYDTRLAELGDSVSGGEKLRIGIARAFLHDSRILFLDEPTSNIDSLNEGMILRSLEQEKEDKTIILVSHRKSTMGIAQEVHAL